MMKEAVLIVLCAVALAHGAVMENGCPVNFSVQKLLPHPNCGQYFQCVHGHKLEMFCAPGLHFSTVTNSCDFPAAANCENSVIVPENPIADHNYPSQAAAICAAEGSEGALVAHETCNRFYKCSYGLPVVIRCPSTLLYDTRKERCEWPDTVECGDRVILDNDSEETGGDWTGNGGGNSDPSQAPAICAAEGSDHIYIAHEVCNQYYKCWAGVPVALDCPPNFLFNPYKDYCDFPYNVDCGDRVINDNHGNDNDNQNDNNDNFEEDVPIGNNHDDPSQAPAICRSAGSEGVLVAHENCNQFYKCNYGFPVPQICPGNLLFDPTKDRCEWRDTVKCGDRIIPEYDDNNNGGEWTGNGAGNNDPSQAPAICAAEGSDHIYIAHENCNQYYKCWAGVPVALDCPPNFFFNPYKDYCDFPYNVNCGDRVINDNHGSDNNNQGNNNGNTHDDVPSGNNHDDPSQAPTICRSADSEGVLIAHEYCNRFYMCSFGLPVAITCPPNLLFDPKIDRCEWPALVDCGDRLQPDGDAEEPDGGGWDGNGAGNDDPSQAPAICAAEGSDHILIAHENCNQFYQCWAGHPVPLYCPPNTFFNPKVDYCDFAENVSCANRLNFVV